MHKRRDCTITFLLFFVLILFSFPLFLRIGWIRNIISCWLSFSDNADYKIIYVQLVGGIIGTFISVYGALFIQREQQRRDEEKKKKECVRNIYTELRTCLSELCSMFRETKLFYGLRTIEKEDIDKFCAVAEKRKLSLSDKWIENLAGAGDLFCEFEINMIYKYYFKLTAIQQAFETKNIDKIQSVFIPYICWFIYCDGSDLRKDVKEFMQSIHEKTA